MLLSCLSKPRSSRKGCLNISSISVWTSLIREIIPDAFSATSWSSMSSAPVMSDSEGTLLQLCLALRPDGQLCDPQVC